MSGTIPGQVVLGSIWKQAEQAIREQASKLHSSVTLLEFLPWLLLVMDWDWGMYTQ